MRCPFCGHEDTIVKDSRPGDEQTTIRRRRLCTACGSRFTTAERVHLRDLSVLKRNGTTEAFDPEKLGRSLRLALHKRPISREQTERILSSLIRQLEMLGESEVQVEVIGAKAMEALSSLDTVAYIRFASIYQNFEHAQDFQTLVQQMTREKVPLSAPTKKRSPKAKGGASES
jgi:transcriptional repressor NrdR